jgi:Putative collagen-binding domain of a collagenase
MSRFKKPVIVKWFDPSFGEYKNVEGSFPNKGVRYFEPPVFNNARGFDDWVLVLEGENE